jgi:hypothetical protein
MLPGHEKQGEPCRRRLRRSRATVWALNISGPRIEVEETGAEGLVILTEVIRDPEGCTPTAERPDRRSD